MSVQRHVWVKEQFGPRYPPGFLLTWRQTPDGWEALVMWEAPAPAGILTDWVPAERLLPGGASPARTGTAYDPPRDDQAPGTGS